MNFVGLRSHLNKLRFRTQRRLERAAWSRFPADGLVAPTTLQKYLRVERRAWRGVLEQAGVELRWVPHKPGMPRHYEGLTPAECRRVMDVWFDRYGAYWRKRLKI